MRQRISFANNGERWHNVIVAKKQRGEVSTELRFDHNVIRPKAKVSVATSSHVGQVPT